MMPLHTGTGDIPGSCYVRAAPIVDAVGSASFGR